VFVGCFSDTEQSSMCEDDELFIVTTKTIVACRREELTFAFEE